MGYEVKKILCGAAIKPKGKLARLSLGISLDNPKYNSPGFYQIIDWCSHNSSHCLIFIGDFLYQYTFRMLKANNEIQAQRTAQQLSSIFIEKLVSYLKNQGVENQFTVVSLMDMSKTDQFFKCRREIERLSAENAALETSITETAMSYITRKKRHVSFAVDDRIATELSRAYLSDEIAFYKMLCDQGWLVEAYPGSEMPVLADILRDRIPGAPEILKKRIFIELGPI